MTDPTLLTDGEILTSLFTKVGPVLAGILYLGSAFINKWFSFKEKKLAHELELQKLKVEKEKLVWQETKDEVVKINKRLEVLEAGIDVIESQVISGLAKRAITQEL